jgi:outer membrane protein OmpA-like peptidoglycan-associated protein
LRLRCAHELLFGEDNAQLRPAALGLLDRVAARVNAQGGFVTHVLVSAQDESADGAYGLSRRRAASIGSELVLDGVPQGRLRAEGRRGAAVIELVFKPVVEGHEAEAWTPP